MKSHFVLQRHVSKKIGSRSDRNNLSVHACIALGLLVSQFAGPASLAAAPELDAAEFNLQLKHQVVSRTAASSEGRAAIELEFVIRNSSKHDLYDLRLYLERVGSLPILAGCAPARLRAIESGDQDGTTHNFDCFIAPLNTAQAGRIELKIEAIDKQSQRIVTFVSISVESN